MPRLRLAIMGTRGIPARYGGFETMAEELGARLVARGHEVTVYGRPRYSADAGPVHRGVKIRILPTIPHKYLDTVVHGLLSFLHSLAVRYDAILVCNAANAPFLWIPRIVGTKVAVNVDGIERQRRKWNVLGRAWYRLGERCAVWWSDRIVSDAEVIRRYYRETYGTESVMIPYGALEAPTETRAALEALGLEPKRYLLYVTRLEPENNADLVLAAYREVRTDMPLVLVGGAPYAGGYIERLRSLADARVKMPGPIYGTGYRELQSHAYACIQATEVGGTHPALVEALGVGNCVLALATPENLEVVQEAALTFPKSVEALRDLMQKVVDDPPLADEYRRRGRARARAAYRWDDVTAAYERLFLDLTGR